jgi:integrase
MALALAQGHSTETLAEIFWLTNAHPHLIELPRIAQNLQAMLQSAQRAWEASFEECGLTDWLPVLRWIVGNRREISRVVGVGGEAEDPFQGKGMTRHPLYSSFWHRHSDPDCEKKYRLLQAHMLVGHVRTLRARSKQADYEAYAGVEEWVPFTGGKLYGYFLGLRHFAVSSIDVGEALRSLSVEQPPKTFAQDRPKGTWKGWSLTYAQAVLRGIRRFHDLRPWPKGGGTRSRSGSYDYWMPHWQKIGDGLYRGQEDPWDADSSSAVISVPSAKSTRDAKQRLRELLNADEDPQEEPENELITAGLNEEANLGSRAAVAWNQVARRAMRNQLLPVGIQAASMAEIRGLLAGLAEEIQGQEKLSGSSYPTDSDLRTLELTALLNVMVWTGRSLKEAMGLRVSPQNDSNPSRVETLALASDNTGSYWRSLATLPHYVLPSRSDSSLRRRVNKFIKLPDHGAGETVRRFVDAREHKRGNPADPKSHILVFSNDESWYAELLNAALKAFDPGEWLTVSRVSQFLFHSVLRVTGGEVSLAALITGNPHSLAQTRLYYAMPRVRTLVTAYTQAVRGLLATEPAPSSVSEKLHIGIAASPHPAALRGLLAELKADIKKPPRKSNPASVSRYHNCFTLYTYLGLTLATGLRAIKLWQLPQFPIDSDNGWTELLDKGRYKARPAWVPPSVRRQLSHLQGHTAGMPTRFLSHHPKPPDGCVPSFLLSIADGELGSKGLGPSAVAALLAEHHFQFPVNFYRRFMRTELLERECPAEVVDAWMGHWKEGEEPWGRYSTFSYARYVEELEPILNAVLRDVGFRPLRSHLRDRS